MLYFILILIILQLVLFMIKSRRDYDIQTSAYENQKIIIGNQHYIADALILIMQRDNGFGKNQTAITKLPDIEDLPN